MRAVTLWRPGSSACSIIVHTQLASGLVSDSEPSVLADRLIRWVQSAYPAGGHQAQLRPLLERCTRELLQHEHYKQDLRYLRVWLQYVSATWVQCYLCSVLAAHNCLGLQQEPLNMFWCRQTVWQTQKMFLLFSRQGAIHLLSYTASSRAGGRG